MKVCERAGTLNPAESKNLQSKLDKIREHVDKVQGKRYGLSYGEVKSINNRLDALSKDVYRERHDRQRTR
jgi:tetrahydromethanopterin S-methyltransferase subunit G